MLVLGFFFLFFMTIYARFYGAVFLAACAILGAALLIREIVQRRKYSKHHVLTNYRAMNVELKHDHVCMESVPYTKMPLVEQDKEEGTIIIRTTSDPMDEGVGDGSITLHIRFSNLSSADKDLAYSIIQRNRSATTAGSPTITSSDNAGDYYDVCPAHMFQLQQSSLENGTVPNITVLQRSILDYNSPILWMNKPSWRSNWKMPIISSICIVLLIFGTVAIPLKLLPAEWLLLPITYIIIIAALIILTFLSMIFFFFLLFFPPLYLLIFFIYIDYD
eukprot:TRINITY_DN5073_c0_g2_i1.p1 TRINITY_DN5073_c0_g2~~TRINITY_DN5073_c0_g2_i1.p1  ORF type:complete len:276 (+),score=30.24 TRINITY_DN5073_c0_g2_i1:301-1128(+)